MLDGKKLFGHWCSCGKPFHIGCKNTIPPQYFSPLTVERAQQIRGFYLKEIYNKNELADIIFQEKSTKIFDNNKNLPTIICNYNYSKDTLRSIVNWKNEDGYSYDFPKGNLTNIQINQLQTLNWDDFLKSLNHYYVADVIAMSNDFQFLFALQIKDCLIKFFANGFEYVFSVKDSGVSARPLSKKKDTIWIEFNTGKYQVDSLEFIYNKDTQKIKL